MNIIPIALCQDAKQTLLFATANSPGIEILRYKTTHALIPSESSGGIRGSHFTSLDTRLPSLPLKNVCMRLGSWLSGKELAAQVRGPEFRFIIKVRHSTLRVM